MKQSTWLVMLCLGILLLSTYTSAVSTHISPLPIAGVHGQALQASATPIPVDLPPPTETPLPRILPPVGTNAGLVLGATLLVLIIIGGVFISSRWRSKH